MIKFLYRFTLLMVVAFVSQLLLYQLAKTILDKYSNFRITRFFRDKQHNYFVLGNSRAVNSINEKYANDSLNCDLINLGFNGQSFENTIDFVDEINENNKNTIIYIEISGIGNDGIDESYSYYISNSRFIKKHYKASMYDRISLLRLNNEFFLRNIYYLTKSDNEWINGNTISKNIIDEANSSKAFRLVADTTKFIDRLKIINQKCIARNNRVVFFLAPYLPQYLIKAVDYKNIKKIIAGNNFEFIDLNKTKLDGNMYADRVHTNLRGSVLLTDKLIGYTTK